MEIQSIYKEREIGVSQAHMHAIIKHCDNSVSISMSNSGPKMLLAKQLQPPIQNDKCYSHAPKI